MSEIFNAPTLNSDPYLRKLRRRGVLTASLIITAVFISIIIIISIILNLPNNQESSKIARQNILDLWEIRDYSEIAVATDVSLAISPLDSFYLIFKGLSNFYLGLAESDGERRVVLMETTIFSIRKALLDTKAPLKQEAIYVLGKAYFYKGRDYYDEAIAYLSESVAAGYKANDTWEYLALSAQAIGLTQESLEYFEQAIIFNPRSPELLVAAANANMEAENIDRVEQLTKMALSLTADDYLAERCNFILGESYRLQKRFEEAILRFESIKEKNPQSADAWYYEGLTYMDAGDPIRARAAWRKAVSIDPMHLGARQKLSER
jgi:tetratricopeptide (TPR) repeat protein